MNHFWYVEITNYLHLFYSNELIVKLSLSQGNILWNLCLFNIREFALKESVINNIILLNPSFYLACSIVSPPLSFFLPLSLFPSLCLAYHVTPPPLSLSFAPPFSMLVLLSLSFFPIFLSYHTLFFSLLYTLFFLFCIMSLHTLIFLLSQTQKGLKTKKKLTQNAWRKTKGHLEEGHWKALLPTLLEEKNKST